MAKIKTRKLSSPFLIGLFVMLGSLILIGAILWLGANQFLKEHKMYVTYFDSSVEGLETGSPVKYQGVPSGSITSIEIAPGGKLVEVIMQLNPLVQIDDSMRVQPAMSGLAGGKFLLLQYPKKPDAKNAYPKVDFEPPYTLIPSAPSDIQEITTATQEVINNMRALDFNMISSKTKTVLDGADYFLQNQDLYETIDNLAETTQRLSNLMHRADTSQIISNLAKSSETIYKSTLEVQKMSRSLANQIDSLQLDTYMKLAYQSYDSTMMATNKVINSIGYRSENLLFTLMDALEELKNTNQQLQKSLRAITDNPSQVFFSEPPPPEPQ